jgi:hypothetical protein
MMRSSSTAKESMNMKVFIRRIAGRCRIAVTGAATIAGAVLSVQGTAQPRPDADQVEKMVDYAQCIRENGYPAFPDPAPDGGFQFRIERGSAQKFQAAQEACKDKMPSGMLQGTQAASPEQIEAQLAFAACMREKGVANFPDPSPQGGFDVNGPNIDLRAPQVQSAMEVCREANPGMALMIRRGG